MYDSAFLHSEKLRWLLTGILAVLTALLILPAVLPSTNGNADAASTTATQASTTSNVGTYDGPNAVANGMSAAADKLDASLAGTEKALSRSGRGIATAASHTGKTVGHSFKVCTTAVGHGLAVSATFIGRGATTGAVFLANSVSSGIAFIVRIPGSILGVAADTPIVSAVITPAADAAVPMIDTTRPAPSTVATHAEASAVKTVAQVQPATKPDAAPEWPIHGEITTMFGVPHWPYQPTHTGIDISDGRASGVTAIKPYRPGKVIDVIRSYGGLGNHVIVDHGDGITSVYGHMSSISVAPDQIVDKTTTLGFEGSTGASTGTHLHLEIRVNGQAVDPLKYIPGRP